MLRSFLIKIVNNFVLEKIETFIYSRFKYRFININSIYYSNQLNSIIEVGKSHSN